MKTLIIGLDGLSLERLFSDERMTNFRHLMEVGCYGKLTSVSPPDTALGWTCLVTGQDPDSLVIDGCSRRADFSDSRFMIVDEASLPCTALWDQIAQEGGQSILVGARCLVCEELATASCAGDIPLPSGESSPILSLTSISEEYGTLAASYSAAIARHGAADMGRLMDAIYNRIHTRFDTILQLLQEHAWNYFHFVEPCLPQIHNVWLNHSDRQNGNREPDDQTERVIQDAYRLLDDGLGEVLAVLDENTAVLIASVHGVGSPGMCQAATEVASGQYRCTQEGAFVLAAPYLSLRGEMEDVHLIDIAPTVLELGGYSVPASMKGTSLATRSQQRDEVSQVLDDEEILRERLSSLGYIS